MDKHSYETQKFQQIFHFDEPNINRIYTTLDNGTYYSIKIIYYSYT